MQGEKDPQGDARHKLEEEEEEEEEEAMVKTRVNVRYGLYFPSSLSLFIFFRTC